MMANWKLFCNLLCITVPGKCDSGSACLPIWGVVESFFQPMFTFRIKLFHRIFGLHPIQCFQANKGVNNSMILMYVGLQKSIFDILYWHSFSWDNFFLWNFIQINWCCLSCDQQQLMRVNGIESSFNYFYSFLAAKNLVARYKLFGTLFMKLECLREMCKNSQRFWNNGTSICISNSQFFSLLPSEKKMLKISHIWDKEFI